MTGVRERVLAYIREHGLTKPGDRVGVAVSGGADSVALLRILLELRDELGIVLSVVHFNHKIRGAEADADEDFVKQLAVQHRLDFHHTNSDVPTFAAKHKLSLETAARRLRYEYFQGLLGSPAAGSPAVRLHKIATGHSLDDQAETVLMRLIRGAGTKGLAGVYPLYPLANEDLSGAAVVRPLLCVRRVEIENYLHGVRQPWREDSSNLDPKHLRNRIRQQLMPTLECHFNRAIVETLSETAELARADEEYFRSELAKVRKNIQRELGPKHAIVNAGALSALPMAISRRLVRATAEDLELNLDFDQVEQVLRLACSSKGGAECELPHGWIVRRHLQELRFERRSHQSQLPSSYEYRLAVPGDVYIKEIGAQIRAFLQPVASGQAGYNPAQFLERQALEAGLKVRNWRPGDRFWPAHTKAPRKIKELLQKRHIAQPEKLLWPVVLSGQTVIWLRGFPTSQRLVGQREVLVIEEVRGESPVSTTA